MQVLRTEKILREGGSTEEGEYKGNAQRAMVWYRV